jgi:hypothetical protein
VSFSTNGFAYLLGWHGMKFTLIEGHYQTFESFPSRSAHEERRRRKKKEEVRRTEREKSQACLDITKRH